MANLNKTMLIGRIGNEIELKSIPGGTLVTTLNIATNDFYIDNAGNKQKVTDWHQVEVWGKLAKTCSEYLSKGSQVFIEGSLKTQVWEDETGTKHKRVFVKAYNIQFLGGGERVDNGQSEPTNPQDDIPM